MFTGNHFSLLELGILGHKSITTPATSPLFCNYSTQGGPKK